MNVYHAENLTELTNFADRTESLGILKRESPEDADIFFSGLLADPFDACGTIRRYRLVADIDELLEEVLSPATRSRPFFKAWLMDMAEICDLFCEIQKTDAVGFWLGSDRGCSRYHVDNVPLRLLVTYAGTGTEWLPDEAADRDAFLEGRPNKDILKDTSAPRFMQSWDVSVFRGGPTGLLHKTPDAALTGPSILMRLDHPSFWERLLRYKTRPLLHRTAGQ